MVEIERLKVSTDHPKQSKNQERKQIKEGQRNNLAVFRWSRQRCYCWLGSWVITKTQLTVLP